MTSVGLVVQARMGSTRLPGKVLRPVGHLTLLGHVIGRLSQLPQRWPVVVATSTDARDDAIVAWCRQADVATFRGSEHDVLDRYLQCARTWDFEHVVRLTADNPFTDVPELERLVQLHLDGGFDYTHSFGMMPLGVGTEVISRSALERSHVEGLQPHHREHVNEYIQEQPELFRIGVLDIPANKRAPNLRLTVDTEEDWRRADALARQARGRWLETQEAIALCSSSA
ncbi:acylneuraminate cytidylyltransferase [Hylemonella gracilis]|jgi:spore coat polysaccharide biosynthesis protein SpsF|uniref:Acylneuraminate cytidylyltransferase n=1 Tax=Hylemonella gracilis TaxID=80880 RepID=A0A4P6UH86_9BURK|nr:glycosyltransferase family protein [Hylemonella gracilis]QBK04412.1 acylneuraminate cytidylyltransferase [Hylemonella gracilis]